MKRGLGFNKVVSILLMPNNPPLHFQARHPRAFPSCTSQHKKTPDLSLGLIVRLQNERSAVIHVRCSSHGPA